jgi:predicted  nucleic acid-binding Zn-ribbon protein
MDLSEVAAWLDKAFEHMYAGDFASAAACFQHVIDKSTDARARRIAQRNLEWYCMPLDAIVRTLSDAPRAMTLEELLSEVSSSEISLDYAQQVSDYLGRVVTVCYLGNQLWIHRSHFETAVELALADFQTRNLPTTLTELTRELLMLLDGQMLAVSEHVLRALRAELAKMDNTFLLDNDCVFTRANLEHFRTELVQSIRQTKKPASLTAILDTMPWPQPVKTALRTKALGQWLYLQGRDNVIEVADDWWFIENLADLSCVSLDRVFRDRFAALDTETILLRHLFDQSQRTKWLSKSFIYSQSRHLARNQSLIKIGDGLWFLAETASDLVRQMIDELAQADRPRSYHELLMAVIPPKLDKSFISDSLSEFLVPRLRQDSQIIEISEGMWLHMAAIEAILDRAYELLQDSRARPGSELLSQCLGVPLSAHQCQASFVSEFELALQQDNRFMLDSRQDLWTAIPPGAPKNNLAYVILYQEHRPLNRQEIVEQARNTLHTQSLAFQLDSDARFKQMPDGRWILARWTIINDLAASYLAQSPIPLLAETITRKVCEAHNIDLADAIFVPEGDPRFVRASLGKWTCPSPGKILSPEMLERLVQSASDAADGITLETLVRISLHESLLAYYNLEQILLDDGRLVHCNGLWYPRDKCFYFVTTDDLEKIRAHITRVGYPVPADVLAQICLDRSICLTDLAEKLDAFSEFIELGSAGWIVQGLQSKTAGRKRQVNYPIRSGKYFPTIDPEEFESVEEGDNDIGSDSVQETPSDRSTQESRVRRVTIALSFEDIRDGTLLVRARFRRLLSNGLELPALRFIDEQDTGFSCWYDADNDLLHGLGGWFKSRELTFGDKIRFSITERDEFSVQVVGERSEQVYLDSVRRSQIQSLIDEAKLANRSYHDLTLGVLEYFGTSIHIDDLWAMVNYRRVARKHTLSVILSGRSYFVSDGSGHWYFDKEEYVRMIRDLERKVRKLEKDNQLLRDEKETLSSQVSEATALRGQVEQLRTDSEAFQEALKESESEIAGLRSRLIVAETRAAEAETLAKQTAEERNQLEASLTAAKQEISALNTELQKQEVAQQHAQEIQELRQRIARVEKDNQRLQMDLEASQEGRRQFESEIARLKSELATAEDKANNAEALAGQLAVEHSQVQASLATAKQEIGALNRELQEQVEVTATREEANRRLSAEVTSLKTQLGTIPEREFQLPKRVVELEEALQQANSEVVEAKQHNELLEKSLTQVEAQHQQIVKQLARLAKKHEVLRAESAKAMAVLESWWGKVAKWWATMHGEDLPVWPK